MNEPPVWTEAQFDADRQHPDLADEYRAYVGRLLETTTNLADLTLKNTLSPP